MALFWAHRALGTKVPTYFIESNAPNNVEDPAMAAYPDVPDRLQLIPKAHHAIKEIAEHLAKAQHPNLVFLVHGFSNPQRIVVPVYAAISDAIERDQEIVRAHDGLVCVGYRWPSEHIGDPLSGTWTALPQLPTWLLRIGVGAVVALTISLFLWGHEIVWHWIGHILVILAWILPGLVITAALLRVVAYFRDNYRAQTYGVPDLVEIIRKIDAEIFALDGYKEREEPRRVQLSFIGHSMGGFVVTNAIRVLSELFKGATDQRPDLDDGVINTTTQQQGGQPGSGRPRAPRLLGHVFALRRFVLASPDIPAEALLSNRANVLQASLLRFDEAYLFSNEGDEVLRQISTIANYFIFPTRTSTHGFRLGNVEILSEGYGVITPAPDDFLKILRVGFCTLHELYQELNRVRPEAIQNVLPKVFTYFDCTDYRDREYLTMERRWGPERPLLTYGLRTKRNNPRKGLNFFQHLVLLASYPNKVNCHGGYFQGDLSQELMYRLVCLGYEAAIATYGGLDGLSARCNSKQIRVVVSPELAP
jgi:hypothetical protein